MLINSEMISIDHKRSASTQYLQLHHKGRLAGDFIQRYIHETWMKTIPCMTRKLHRHEKKKFKTNKMIKIKMIKKQNKQKIKKDEKSNPG